MNLPPALVKPVRAVAVAPDGKSVAASRGNQVHLFELKTTPAAKKGDKDTTEWAFSKSLFDPQLKTPDGKAAKAAHISLVESMAFSPDGKTLVTGSFQELTVWDAAKGEPTKRVGGFADRVCCIAFSADGKRFVTGGGAPTEDGEIKVFDTDTGKLFTEIKAGHSRHGVRGGVQPGRQAARHLRRGQVREGVRTAHRSREAGQVREVVSRATRTTSWGLAGRRTGRRSPPAGRTTS